MWGAEDTCPEFFSDQKSRIELQDIALAGDVVRINNYES